MLQSRLTDTQVDYILLSDVHLGADLVEHVRPWSRDSWLTQKAEIDDRLEAMFDHHVAHATRPIQFVVAGDFIDFIGMAISPPSEGRLHGGVTEDERLHGLGNGADRSAFKVAAVAARHARVFRALARALDAGHRLAIVHGNHDTEWHWFSARRAFLDALGQELPKERQGALRRRVTFHPWFYHVPGLLYVEHGHEYDPMCGFGDPLVPVCPRNPRNIRGTPSAVLLRYVARPTRGLSTFGHEQAGFGTYLAMAASFGLVGATRLFRRFVLASLRLLVDTQAFRAPAGSLAQRSDLRLQALGRKQRLSIDVLRALRAHHVRPAALSLRRLLCSLYWDRLALCAFVALAWSLALASAPYAEAVRWSIACTVCAALFGVVSGHDRDIDPAPRMRQGARHIARTLGVRFVVMGHTHAPRFDPLDGDARYVNLGHWGQDELPEDRAPHHEAPISSYLHLSAAAGGHRAELLRWSMGRGPLPLGLALDGEPSDATSPGHPVDGSCGRPRDERLPENVALAE